VGFIQYQKIATWFQNHATADSADKDPESHRGVRSFIRATTAKDAGATIFKHKVLEEINNQTDAAPGSKDWLAKYPAGLSKVFSELDDDEIEECERTMEKWNKNGPGEKKQQL
jgi:hypothetical protein